MKSVKSVNAFNLVNCVTALHRLARLALRVAAILRMCKRCDFSAPHKHAAISFAIFIVLRILRQICQKIQEVGIGKWVFVRCSQKNV